MSVMTRLFSNDEIIVYEQQEKSIFGVHFSNYYWSYVTAPTRLVGPFNSVLSATTHYETTKKENEAAPNVIHVNFLMKQRMVKSPNDFKPLWTICICGQHYDESLRRTCPNCGRSPMKVL